MSTEIVPKPEVQYKPEHPWDIQPDESSMAYEAFLKYRDLGIRRTIAQAAAELGRTSPSQLHKWSGEHKWAVRVRQYDNFLDKVRQKEHEAAIREMSRKQAEIGAQMQDLAKERIQEFAATPEMRATISAREAVLLAVEGVKIERLARGKSTENVEHALKLVLPMVPDWAPDAVKAQIVADSTIEGEPPKVLNGD